MADMMNINPRMFMNFNSIATIQQKQQQQQLQQLQTNQQPMPTQSQQYQNTASMKVNPRMQGMGGPDSLFVPGQQLPGMNFGSFQSNVSFAPNMLNSSTSSDGQNFMDFSKRKMLLETEPKPIKKMKILREEPVKTEQTGLPASNMFLKFDDDESNAPAPVGASKEGTACFEENDVLSGRGGGTNVHPGNRNFRDLINLHRRAYLKARKNDKPAISRAIVRAIREKGGRFLKKKDRSNLWYEIGDDAAREKTSQALRQRAPEMRKLLFETEREEARVVAEDQLRQQQRVISMNGMNHTQTAVGMMTGRQDGAPSTTMMNPAFLQAMAANNNFGGGQEPTNQQLSSMFSTAILQNGINRFDPNASS